MTDFDAIVIGSGISGGWAAKELAERGLKTLVLERGRDISPTEDYADMIMPWDRPNLDEIPEDEVEKHYFVQHKGASWSVKETTKHLWVKDDEHPYTTEDGAAFDWLRGYHKGGRSLLWGRQSYRLGPQDFEANLKDGHGHDWPIRYNDLAPWYDHVEKFAGISGNRDGLEQLPDGQFQPAFELTAGERVFKERVESAFPTRNVISSRIAHLTDPTEEQRSLGRAPCQSRNLCDRGCIFGAYFSSNSATLPAAERTGNYTLVTDAIVQEILYDSSTKRVTGVRVIDAKTKQGRTYTARVIFLNASTVGSTMIMMNSTSEAFPNGLANRSGMLGRNLIDHVSGGWAQGELEGMEDLYHFGRAPAGIYIPRYVNITEHTEDFHRGFGYQGNVRRTGWSGDRKGVGPSFKEANRTPGPWSIWIYAFGEVLPNPDSRMYLHPTKKDQWGMPIPVFDTRMGDNELKMMQRASRDAKAMVEAAGARVVYSTEQNPISLTPMGNRIHEMGTAAMGRDPSTSVLNGWNQAHDIPNLFCTDGASMPSGGCQNPSLTYMALSARAANHAADLLQDGAI